MGFWHVHYQQRHLGPVVRAVIFDLDDTLIEDMNLVSDLVHEVCSGDDELAARVVKIGSEIWRAAPIVDLARRLGISSWEGLAADFIGGHACIEPLRAFAPNYRREVWTAAGAPHLSGEFYALRRERNRLLPGSTEALEDVRARGMGCALVTNGPPDLQRLKLQATGLADHFDVIVISGECGYGKPEREIFELALTQLSVAAADAVMVGDSDSRDIAGAMGIGMTAVKFDGSTALTQLLAAAFMH